MYYPAQLYGEAHTAGLAAMYAVVPTPRVMRPNWDSPLTMSYEPEGQVGYAWIAVASNTSMGKWLVKHKYGQRSAFEPEVQVWVEEGGNSYERKQAYAAAFAEVLRKAGVYCQACGRLQ